MPSRPPSACAQPGCPHTIPCPDHPSGTYARDAGYVDRAQIYSSTRWRGLRRKLLAQHPWCGWQGCQQLATDIDHDPSLRAILEAGDDPYDARYLTPLCKMHHSVKTRQEEYGHK